MDEVEFGRYRLVELIGEGGMGQVFKAHDTVIGRNVAIKVLPPEMGNLEGYRSRFRREAHVAARLAEPHIVPIHDTGEIDGRLYLVMPIIDGVDVQTVLEREGPMSPPRAVQVIRQLAAALNAAHRHGLVHRDVKPSNALMTADDHVYLIDFGIAHDASATRLTQTGMMVGTFSYMAPERFLAGTVDARADVYALTCVLHECLTGAAPFPGTSMEQQIAAHLTAEPPKPSTVNPAVPTAFDDVIARGMAKQPGERYQSAAELSAAAQHALSATPIPQPAPPGPPPPPPRQPPTQVDHRHPPQPRYQQPVMSAGPAGPTMSPTQPAPVPQPMPLVGPAPEAPAPTISAGRFACALAGVVLVSCVLAERLLPWEDWQGFVESFYRGRTPAGALCWLVAFGTIPGIALLARGHGRAHEDRTITGTALVTLGLGTFVSGLDTRSPSLSLLVEECVGAAGLLLILVALYPRTTRALARGCVVCGVGVFALTIIALVYRLFGWAFFYWDVLTVGAVIGLTLTVAGGVASGLARRSAQSPAAAAGR